jgi:hypothetical protein
MTEVLISLMIENKTLRWTDHIMKRLMQRNISMDDVEYALMYGEIIEQYPSDYPYPSCLVLGYTKDNMHLHVVCGTNQVELWLITAYYPNSSEWTEDFKQRNGGTV